MSSNHHRYVLDKEGRPRQEPELLVWSRWFENTQNWQVARTNIGNTIISTVFLGVDQNYQPGPPIFWQTMVFGGPLSDTVNQCAGNREQAEAMHAAMVEKVRSQTSEQIA